MRSSLRSFKRGVHPPSGKELTAALALKEMPAPARVYIPAVQHIGAPAKILVKPGDKVKIGQIIAEADGMVSAHAFASVCGTVFAIENRQTPNGSCDHIVIDNDFSDERQLLDPIIDPTPADIVKRVSECGIVGMGGAGFPLSVKLKPREKIDTFIINAAECEPYITCDYRLMLEHADELISGAALLARAVDAGRIIIATEENKADAAAHLRERAAATNQNVEVMVLKTKYPQGAEKQLIYACLDRKVAPGKLPSSVGVIVDNVHTALSAYKAITEGEPLTMRAMTVTGGGVANPANLWVRNGTLYGDVIQFTGGYSEQAAVKFISGGPMMGIAVSGDVISVTKTTSCLLLLTAGEAFTGKPQPCINCGKCARSCPMKLMPMYIDAYALAGDRENAVKYGAQSCIECGCCAFVCPAKRPLVQSIRRAKKMQKERG